MEVDDKTFEFIIAAVTIIFIILYLIYLILVIIYLVSNFKSKKLSVYWINYCFLIISGILFIIAYIISLFKYTREDEEDEKDGEVKKYTTLQDFSDEILPVIIISLLNIMCLTIIHSVLLDAIIAFKLSIKMKNIGNIQEKDFKSVSRKFDNINITNILKMKFVFAYYLTFLIINIILAVICILTYLDLDVDHYDSFFTLRNYGKIVLKYYHLASLALLIISIIIMNICKKRLLRKKYYSSDDRLTQKLYDFHYNQIIYYTDVITFKLVSDLIMDIPALIFLANHRFNIINLLISEAAIFVYIFMGGNENFVLDKNSRAGKISKSIKFWFCTKKINFHFGEKDHKLIFSDSNFYFTKEEENIINNLNMTVVKSLEKHNIIENDIDTLYNNNMNENNLIIEIDSKHKSNKKLELNTVSEFYLIQKLLEIHFSTNKETYETSMNNSEENFLAFKKLDVYRKTKNFKNLNEFITNINRISRLSIKDVNNLKPSQKVWQSEIFKSVEEKEIFEELKDKLDIKNEDHYYKIESILYNQMFELFPFYQINIDSIINSLNPKNNMKLFKKFVNRNKNTNINITNKINDKTKKKTKPKHKFHNNFFEKNLYYTNDLYLMYEIYDKDEFIDLITLNKILGDYKEHLLSVIKNMNYSFLPLIIGIFSLEIYNSHKILLIYRNPLYFSNFNKYNHWLNFYVNEEPEKMKISSLYNDIIDVNEIEIRDTLELNEADYKEIKNVLDNDFKWLKSIDNVFPIIHLFLGDENNGALGGSTKIKKNEIRENSITEPNQDIPIYEILEKDLNSDDDSRTNIQISEDSLFEKEYFYISGNDLRTIKIYFTNIFRKENKLNQMEKNEKHKIDTNYYCIYISNQLMNYFTKKELFNEDDDDKDDSLIKNEKK